MKYFVNWNTVEEFVDIMNERYHSENLPGVYGLPRGGLVLAVMISHKMDIPLLMAPVKGCLIVDDICDSGESLIHYAKNSSSIDKPEYHIATMFFKEGAEVEPEYYQNYKGDDWIVFPWENKEE